MIAALLCIGGLAALLFGAELLIRSGAILAGTLRIAPIVIGLTIVSIGTSLPELAVGIEAAFRGSDGLAIGNIAGTNTFNILFILGLTAALSALAIETRAVRIELPAMIIAALALLVMALDGRLTRIEGALLVLAGLVYTVISLRAARNGTIPDAPGPEPEPELAEPEPAAAVALWRRLAVNLTLLVVSIAIILIGADWLVQGSIALARSLGVSETLIGLTVIAIGTSSPELVTTLVATLRRQRDIAVGNLLGSSIYNILFILGLTITASPQGLQVDPQLVRVDIPVMVAAAFACIPVFLTAGQITRREGVLMVAAYLAYFAWLIFARS